jgi:hypothetical protein
MTQEVTPAAGQEPAATPPENTDPPSTDPPAEGDEGKGGEGKTFSEDYVRELRSEAAKHRTRAQEAQSELQELQDRDASDVEKANRRAERAEGKLADMEARLLRHEIANEKQVPAEAVDLLTGTTREDLEAQADKIIALRGEAAAPKPPDFASGPRDPSEPPMSPEQAHREFLSKNLFGGGNAAT